MENKFSFEDLLVYGKALDFVDCVYEWTQKFPKEEKLGWRANSSGQHNRWR